MRTTTPHHPRPEPLGPRGIIWFLVLATGWVVWSYLPRCEWPGLVLLARAAGYAAAAALAVPYLHIALRTFRSHPGRMSYWLRWHIAAAYVGFFCLLLHCQARGSSPLTHLLIGLTWVVMATGVLGFYGQKFLYAQFPAMLDVAHEFRFMPLEPERARLESEAQQQLTEPASRTVADPKVRGFVQDVIDFLSRPLLMNPREYGLERLEPERVNLWEQARAHREELFIPRLQADASKKMKKVAEDATRAREKLETEAREQGKELDADASARLLETLDKDLALIQGRLQENIKNAPASEKRILEFTQKVMDSSLSQPFRFWDLLRHWRGKAHSSQTPEEREYVQVRLRAGDTQRRTVDNLWKLVLQRRQMDREYLLHHLGRCWLFVHGPAAWLLLVLVLEHVVLSLWYGGW